MLFCNVWLEINRLIEWLLVLSHESLLAWKHNPPIKIVPITFIPHNLKFIEWSFTKVLLEKNYQKGILVRWRTVYLAKFIWIQDEPHASCPHLSGFYAWVLWLMLNPETYQFTVKCWGRALRKTFEFTILVEREKAT